MDVIFVVYLGWSDDCCKFAPLVLDFFVYKTQEDSLCQIQISWYT